MSTWSPELQEETQRILRDMPPQVFAFNEKLGRKGVIVKNTSGAFGYVTLRSCLDEHYLVQDNKTDATLGDFDSISKLLTAGWAVD